MKHTAMKRFIDNVKTIMESRGLTVQEVADSCGMRRPNLSVILNGREGVTLDRAERIAEALDVDLSDLISKHPLVTS